MITVASDHVAVSTGLRTDATKAREAVNSGSAGDTGSPAASKNPYSS